MNQDYDIEEYDDMHPRSDEEEMYDEDCLERTKDMQKELKEKGSYTC